MRLSPVATLNSALSIAGRSTLTSPFDFVVRENLFCVVLHYFTLKQAKEFLSKRNIEFNEKRVNFWHFWVDKIIFETINREGVHENCKIHTFFLHSEATCFPHAKVQQATEQT